MVRWDTHLTGQQSLKEPFTTMDILKLSVDLKNACFENEKSLGCVNRIRKWMNGSFLCD